MVLIRAVEHQRVAWRAHPVERQQADVFGEELVERDLELAREGSERGVVEQRLERQHAKGEGIGAGHGHRQLGRGALREPRGIGRIDVIDRREDRAVAVRGERAAPIRLHEADVDAQVMGVEQAEIDPGGEPAQVLRQRRRVHIGAQREDTLPAGIGDGLHEAREIGAVGALGELLGLVDIGRQPGRYVARIVVELIRCGPGRGIGDPLLERSAAEFEDEDVAIVARVRSGAHRDVERPALRRQRILEPGARRGIGGGGEGPGCLGVGHHQHLLVGLECAAQRIVDGVERERGGSRRHLGGVG